MRYQTFNDYHMYFVLANLKIIIRTQILVFLNKGQVHILKLKTYRVKVAGFFKSIATQLDLILMHLF